MENKIFKNISKLEIIVISNKWNWIRTYSNVDWGDWEFELVIKWSKYWIGITEIINRISNWICTLIKGWKLTIERITRFDIRGVREFKVIV